MKKCGLANFGKVKFPAQNPEMVLKIIPAESVDFILSIAVFQHFPSKVCTQRVLHVMEKLLKKDGLALIQVRYFDGSEKYRQKDSDYAKNVITMTSFTFGEFSEQLQQARLTLLHSEKDIEPDELCHEYYLVKK
jgi:SAM-dependent methyltransferase